MANEVLVELAKIAGAAVAGALSTLWITRRTARIRQQISADIHDISTIGIEGPVFAIKAQLDGQLFDILQLHKVTVKNIGTDPIEDLTICLWDDIDTRSPWFVKIVQATTPDVAQVKPKEIKESYVQLKCDHLNQGEELLFVLIANRRLTLRIASRTKGVKLTDLREKRARALKIGNAALRILSTVRT